MLLMPGKDGKKLFRFRDENLTIRTKFHENLSMLNDTVESLKNVEKAKNGLEDLVSIEKIQRLEHENSMLKAAVEVYRPKIKELKFFT